MKHVSLLPLLIKTKLQLSGLIIKNAAWLCCDSGDTKIFITCSKSHEVYADWCFSLMTYDDNTTRMSGKDNYPQ